jgi:opacity protein-like surface antigen
MRYAGISLGLALLLALPAAPADAGETGWRVRGFGAFLSPDTSETVVNGDGDDILIDADHGVGGGGDVEYQFHRHVGVDAGIVAARPEITLSADIPGLGALSVSDNLSTVVFTGDLVVHLTPGSPVVDLYVGGGIAAVAPGSLSFDVLGIERLNVEAEHYLTWSARAGLDLSLGKDSPWAASLGVRYIPGDVEFRQLGVPADDDSADIGFNLLTFTAGLGYRF